MILTRPSPFQFLEADVYVIWGQSNAQGKAPLANLPSALSGSRPNAYLWDGSSFTNLQAQVNSGYPQVGQDWGLEMLLSELAQANRGRPVFIVKHAQGGVPLTTTTGITWNPDIRGSFYDAAFASLRAAMNFLRGRGRNPIIRGLVWGQGENDSTAAGKGSTYQTNLTTLYNAVRSLAGNPNLPIADMLVRGKYSGYPAFEEINTAKGNVASALGNIRLIKTAAFGDTGDDIHYDAPAQLAFGRHAFEYIDAKTYPLPSGLPAPAFWYDLALQSGYETDGVQLLKTLKDMSGNGRDLMADSARYPAVIEGLTTKASALMRMASTKGFVSTWTDPFSGGFTLAFILQNFTNATTSSVRTVMRSGASGSWVLAFFSGSAPTPQLLRLRVGASTVALQSSVQWTSADAHIVVVTYVPGGPNFMRFTGVQVASSATNVANATGGIIAVGDTPANSLSAELPAMIGLPGVVTTTQAERIEGYLSHRYGIPLPSGHPFASAPPS